MIHKSLTAKGIKCFHTPKVGVNAGKVTSYIEQVVIYENGYPVALVHIDLFYSQTKSETYEKLNSGEEVDLEISFE